MKDLGEGLTVQDIKKHIHCNGIDKDYDNALYKYRLIQQYKKDHPDDNKITASQALTKIYGKGFSKNTVDKYWEKEIVRNMLTTQKICHHLIIGRKFPGINLV